MYSDFTGHINVVWLGAAVFVSSRGQWTQQSMNGVCGEEEPHSADQLSAVYSKGQAAKNTQNKTRTAVGHNSCPDAHMQTNRPTGLQPLASLVRPHH